MADTKQSTDQQLLALPNLPLFDDDEDIDEDSQFDPKRAKRRRRFWIITSAVILLAIIIGGSIFYVFSQRKTPVTYTFQKVTQGNLTLSVSATGPLQGGIYNVNASTSAKITELDVKVGDVVKAGQVLAKLDVTALQDAVSQAQTGVNNAQTSLDNANTNLNNAYAQGAITLSIAYTTEQNAIAACKASTTSNANCIPLAQEQYAQSQQQVWTQESSAQQQVKNAEGQLSTAQAQLQTAQDNLNNATIVAPHAGTVSAVNGLVGELPGTGSSGSGSSSSSSGFIQIVDLSALTITAQVNEADIAGIALGETAQFTVTAYPSRTFQATVTSMSPLGQTTSNVVTYPVTLTVNMSRVQSVNLLPGMTANATIITAQRTGVLLIPASAVTYARQALAQGTITRNQVVASLTSARQMLTDLRNSGTDLTKENPSVSYILEQANNQWIIKPVVLGLTNGTNYEVLAGLSAGESLVTGVQGSTTTTTTSSGSLIPGGGGFFNGGGTGGGRGGNGGTGGSNGGNGG